MSSLTIGQQLRVWYGSTISKVVSDTTISNLASQWQHVRDERLPTIEDFWHKPQTVIADYAILLLKGDRDYTYLHHGKMLQQRVGFGMQGKTLSELRTPIKRRMKEVFDHCTGEMVPGYFQCFDEYGKDGALWGYLCMPVVVSSDNASMALVIYCHFIEDKPAIFKSLFDRSSYAIIIAEPIRNQFGQFEDAWIVSRNASAAPYCRNHATGGMEVELRQTALFNMKEVWEAVTEQAQRGLGQVSVRTKGSDKPPLQVMVEMIEERLVLRIVEMEEALVSVSLD